MLIENTLWGKRDKVQIAITRLQEMCPREGYYLAFGGGKDSVVLLRLAQMAGVKFDAHYNITTVDPPELVRFVRTVQNVEMCPPRLSMFKLILEKGTVPMRNRRFCCEELKERGGSGRVVLTGIRWAESPRRRATRRMVETCYKDKTKTYLHPIIEWEDCDVWEFIRQYEVPYCSLYDEGFSRLGCVLCPMSVGSPQFALERERWPRFERAYIRTFDKLLTQDRVKARNLSWQSGQELFDWWIGENQPAKIPEGQLVLFE